MKRRYFIKLGALGTLVSTVDLAACTNAVTEDSADVVVVGGSPAGIMAAIAAARSGAKVILVEYHNHIGGLSTSGLGKSDIENKDAIIGLFREFTENILRYYTDTYGADSENVKKCRQGYYYEPSVAEKVFNTMIAREKNISLRLNYQIEKAVTEADQIKEAVFSHRSDNDSLKLKAQVFIDATYEGDLYALAGAAYRLGREGKDEFNEVHAGRIFFDYNENKFLAGSTGAADKKIPAYTYRLCFTDDPANSYVMKEPPLGYDRKNYLKYFDDLKEGRLSGPKVYKEGHGYYKAHFDTMLRVFSFAEIPNRKFDVNTNPRPLGFPFPEENADYVEAGWKQREKIFARHRALALGLLYFIQNDEEVPAEHRKMANQYHLAKDEFKDNNHFPWQLYVREARRLKGVYTLTENDVTLQEGKGRTTIFDDSIIAGEFPIDSFPASKEPSPDKKVLEGYIGMLPISPYQIPYRALLPEKINGIIVPVAASTTHAAYSTLRMEPLWMGIGQAAGTAAAIAIKNKVVPREVSVSELQKQLLANGQILTYFEDLDLKDKAALAAQFWGSKGFFDSYLSDLHQPVTGVVLTRWAKLFQETAGTNRASSTYSGETVSIADFLKSDVSLGHDTSWLYDNRSTDSPVLRGEICQAFYTSIFGKAHA
ncbi:Thiamine thiazole synthase [Dyadobacter sp. CECT 9275]|uniref:Thiamine thiazole synthase n=1 Tax=Dyadobacter helix TaxID=2822344 RepID=A0A916NCW6_9BACT|nr:FAD-dependent oxidoreductase [Dyadobacter sp. CECT 9275]CAG5004511.1 Thiamine thiazole synthase [Dyadobacter sp. CECT 9275]